MVFVVLVDVVFSQKSIACQIHGPEHSIFRLFVVALTVAPFKVFDLASGVSPPFVLSHVAVLFILAGVVKLAV